MKKLCRYCRVLVSCDNTFCSQCGAPLAYREDISEDTLDVMLHKLSYNLIANASVSIERPGMSASEFDKIGPHWPGIVGLFEHAFDGIIGFWNWFVYGE